MHIQHSITGQGHPLIFIHGAYIDERIWERQVEGFSQHYQVILVQLPSHGQAKGLDLEEYRVHHFSSEVMQLMDTLQLKKAVFIGLSLGAMIAQHIGAQHAERVSGLVLIGNVMSMRLTALEKLMTQVMFPKWLALRVFGSLSTKQFLKLAFFLTWFMRGNKWLGARPTRQRIREMIAGMERSEIKKVFAAVYTFRRQDLSNSTFPMLLINGEYDSPVIHYHAKRFVKAYPARATFRVMPACGHACNYDDPEGFEDLLRSWFLQQGIPASEVNEIGCTSEYSKSPESHLSS